MKKSKIITLSAAALLVMTVTMPVSAATALGTVSGTWQDQTGQIIGYHMSGQGDVYKDGNVWYQNGLQVNEPVVANTTGIAPQNDPAPSNASTYKQTENIAQRIEILKQSNDPANRSADTRATAGQNPSDYKATELQAQHEEQQTELRAEFNNLKAAKYNQSPSAYKDAEISAQEASIGNPDNIKGSDYKTAVLKRQASEKEAQEHNISGTDYRKSVTKLQELNKKDSAKTTETTETTNKVAGKEAVKVNPIVSSGTVSIHSAQPESAKAVKATATGTKATTTSATKSANQNEVKTLAASLPTTGDDAGLSLFLTFIGMILFGAVGVILALFQKHGRHSK
ncbi:hypothetical protein [Lactococcus lactis]|uniref:Uncharacterized protein n=1 Tax=Lactococcus lactis TaxID=1358 RepID=A0AAP8E101_9LACT|nr:hypothetical protein [Lactococcus lactis]AIS04232.1 hypothetical protein LG36_1637 [Lactococcus lactis]MDG4971538.1 hypothetical protein [Lactococcus lactis]PFG88699.1 hypothetical protein BW154_04145 [Lactococcus lactis]QQE99573.1 hypothetical protein LacL0098_08670 [Lactococcus lactis]RHJ29153.1 hypothetical protein DW134_04160 [Lactococcus lactis]